MFCAEIWFGLKTWSPAKLQCDKMPKWSPSPLVQSQAFCLFAFLAFPSVWLRFYTNPMSSNRQKNTFFSHLKCIVRAPKYQAAHNSLNHFHATCYDRRNCITTFHFINLIRIIYGREQKNYAARAWLASRYWCRRCCRGCHKRVHTIKIILICIMDMAHSHELRFSWGFFVFVFFFSFVEFFTMYSLRSRLNSDFVCLFSFLPPVPLGDGFAFKS